MDMVRETSAEFCNGKVEVYKIGDDKFLYIDGKLWMWDTPEEREDQREIARRASGDVLVGGYGFGLVQRFLTSNRRVNSILTVEISQTVMEACKKIYGNIYGKVDIGDFF